MNKHLFYLSLCIALWKYGQGSHCMNVQARFPSMRPQTNENRISLFDLCCLNTMFSYMISGQNTMNLTFFQQKLSWRNASIFCSQHDGVLESNTTLVMQNFENISKIIHNVWVGKYVAYSNWSYIRGCFLINGYLLHFSLEQSEELDCQKLCDRYTFYTVRGKDCYCTDDISSFERKADCNCAGCHKVFEHEIQHLQPHTCFKIHRDQKNETREKSGAKCSRRFSFFCRFGTNDTDGETIFISNMSPDNGKPDDATASAIGGTLSAVLVIVLFGITVLFLYKRRKISEQPQTRSIQNADYSKDPNSHINENNSDGQYHEIHINTVDYSLAKPLSSNQKLAYKTEVDKKEYTGIVSSAFEIQNAARETNNTISNPGYNDMTLTDSNKQDETWSNPKVDNMNVSDYALAKPITDIEELDLYTAANSDYDHLNSVKKSEMSDVKVYDHLKNAIESDPTYDHAGVTVREDTENYEHFNIEK